LRNSRHFLGFRKYFRVFPCFDLCQHICNNQISDTYTIRVV
jgi:hypothetical protein